jgi:polar amino acid transport system permease protein
MAEILRAGMLAVPKPEIEAALALGASRTCILRRIIVPRGLAIALPAIGNQFNSVLKNTTLVSVIGVSEALLATQAIDAAVFRTFDLYAVLALYFLLLTSLWNITLYWLETRIRRAEHPQRKKALLFLKKKKQKDFRSWGRWRHQAPGPD